MLRPSWKTLQSNRLVTPHTSRRRFVSAGLTALLGLDLPRLLQARDIAPAGDGRFGRAKACIMLFMWGGPAQQDTWDLKPDAPAEYRGEFKPISTAVPGIQICEHFPELARRVDQLAIIRSMTHDNVDHTAATSYLLTGQAPRPAPDRRADNPHVGAVLAKLGRGVGPLPPFINFRPELPGDVPRFVEESQGQHAGWIGPLHDPLTIDADPNSPEYSVGEFELTAGMTVRDFERREDFLRNLESAGGFSEQPASAQFSAHYRRAFELLYSSHGREAFDLRQESDAVRDRYGRNAHGQSVLQSRRLVERGVPLVTVFWPNDGIKNVSVYWDTHSRNFRDLRERLMPVADQAFSALLDDLSDRGMLDETLVIWSGEFGRTPRIGQRNSDAGAGADGRDHWSRCFTTVLAGGGIQGGQVYGSSDRFAAFPASNPTRPMDVIATAYHLLGVPADLTLHDQENRPHHVVTGRVLRELIG
jgi:hypothetical protein